MLLENTVKSTLVASDIKLHVSSNDVLLVENTDHNFGKVASKTGVTRIVYSALVAIAFLYAGFYFAFS